MKLIKIALLGAFAVASSLAVAMTLDFEDITSVEGDFVIPSGGFNFNFSADGWLITPNGYDSSNITENGTSRLLAAGERNGNSAQVLFKPIDDSAFDVMSMDLAVAKKAFSTGEVEIIGNLEGGGTVSTFIDLDLTYTNHVLSSAFSNLDSMIIRSTGSGNYFTEAGFAVDNIEVSVVPEPMTLSLLGLGAVALLRRRRSA